MWKCAIASLLVAGALAGCAAGAAAQERDDGYGTTSRLSAGGEIAGVIGPRDDIAFFNYTDYHTNALRVGRLRLFGEWRAVMDRLSVIAELRSENLSDVDAHALYLRWRPLAARNLFVQAGRVPPVLGAFPRRAYGRDNAVIGLPLGYQYLTSLRPDALPATHDDLLRMSGRGWQSSFPVGSPTLEPGISLLAVSRWDTGVEASWSGGRGEVAAAVTQGSPAVPVVKDRNGGLMVSSRAAAFLPAGITLGVSAGRGRWIDDAVLVLASHDLGAASSQTVIGADFELGLNRWLIRSEWIRSSFELPFVDDPPDTVLTAWAGFVEARYQLLPRWQLGTRVERLDFSTLTGTLNGGVSMPWDAPVDRLEATVAFRAARHVDIRAGWQENWRSAGRVRTRGFPALAALCWF
jgi:hypothetical protein